MQFTPPARSVPGFLCGVVLQEISDKEWEEPLVVSMSEKEMRQEAEEEAIRDRDKDGQVADQCLKHLHDHNKSTSVSVFKNSNVKRGGFQSWLHIGKLILKILGCMPSAPPGPLFNCSGLWLSH